MAHFPPLPHNILLSIVCFFSQPHDTIGATCGLISATASFVMALYNAQTTTVTSRKIGGTSLFQRSSAVEA